jgi:type II secretory pathway component PulL
VFSKLETSEVAWARRQTLQGIFVMRTVLSTDWRVPSMAAAACLLLGLALAAPSTPAIAQGTPEQRAACEQDAYRFCNQYIPDERRTAACLRRHRVSLSPACRRMFSGRRR